VVPALLVGARPQPEIDESTSVDVDETVVLVSPIDRIGKRGQTEDVISNASIAQRNTVPALRRRRSCSSGGPSPYRGTDARRASSPARPITRVIRSGRAWGRHDRPRVKPASPGAVATLRLPRLRTIAAAANHPIGMMSDRLIPGALGLAATAPIQGTIKGKSTFQSW